MSESLFSQSGGLDPEVVEAAREELRRRLPELRKLPGFPIGSDEDILRMSVPPYYTACPNPFIEDWLEETKPEGYDDREYVDPGPFVSDVSEGKTHPIYKAHSFWTKVPHKAIMRYILHYTRPGDVVLDGFSGSGMTGVAAQACGAPEPEFRQQVEAEMGAVEWGARRAVLQDLSPIATFISAGLNLPVDAAEFDEASQRILDKFEAEWGWMYETTHTDGSKAKIDYTIWSEVFTCPNCGGDIVFYDAAYNPKTGRVASEFHCPHCASTTTKRRAALRTTSVLDPNLGVAKECAARVPVRIAYSHGDARHEKVPDEQDLEVLDRVRRLASSAAIPIDAIPYMHMTHERNDLSRLGVTHFPDFWPYRARVSLSWLWEQANAAGEEASLALKFWIEQAFWGLSWMNRYEAIQFGRLGGSQVNRSQSGVYYISSLVAECSPRYNLEGSMPSRGKRRSLVKMWANNAVRAGNVAISTGSSERVPLPSDSVDYVFVDPPFGENIYYSDLNYLIERWHGVLTADENEAIVDRSKREPRSLPEYQSLMARCFSEFRRVLKPGRWMTVEFSNSSNEVWLAIQEALSQAGFVTADTRVLDKDQLSYRQVTAKNAVKRDLIISAYKPSSEVEERFSLVAGSPEGAWEFVREHLSHLPIAEGKRGEARVVRERMADRLYDRMVAYHIHRGVTVPLTAAEFYQGLEQRFPVRDDMYFLPEQVEAYERHRMTVKDLIQAELFITNEQSAVQWLRQLLKKKPRTYAEIQPLFFSELQAGLPEWEALPELRDLLEESFLQDDQDRWYVPDPKKAEDLEKLRTKALLREFETYLTGKGKLDRFRSEAVRAGFKDAWARRDFQTILAVAKRLPDDAFVEDEALLYYHDNARRLAGS